jgi:hypothetical protein
MKPLKLTAHWMEEDADTDAPIWIDADNINYYYAKNDYVKIYMKFGYHVYVKETEQEIYDLMERHGYLK